MKQERITSVDEVPPVKYHYKAVHIATNSCGSVNFICLAEANRSDIRFGHLSGLILLP
jgi:hypothetical protein